MVRSPVARTLAFLAVLAAGSVLLRAPFLSVPMVADEGGYAYVAKFWTSDFQLYRDIPFDRPQAIFFLYRLAFAVFGADVVAIRLFAAFYNAVTVVATFVLCRRVLGPAEAWTAAALLAVFGASPRIEGFTANAELFMLLPIVVSAYLAWSRRWFWAGLAGAMAVLLKPSGGSALLLAVAWATVVRAGLSSWLQVGAGAALGLLPSLVHGVWVGSEHFLESLYLRLDLYDDHTLSLSNQWDAFEAGLERTVSGWAFPAIAAALAALKVRGPARLFGGLWLAFSLLGLAVGGWWRPHYFMQLTPPLAFLGALGLRQLRPATPNGLAWCAALAFALAIFVQRDAALATRSPDEISWTLFQRPGYLLSDEIAEYVRSTTQPDDRIYVAFAQADLYYLSGRRGAAPQYYYLLAESSKKSFDSVIAAIEARDPALVVLIQRPPPNRMSASAFLEILERGYTPVRGFATAHNRNDPIVVFRRKSDLTGAVTPATPGPLRASTGSSTRRTSRGS